MSKNWIRLTKCTSLSAETCTTHRGKLYEVVIMTCLAMKSNHFMKCKKKFCIIFFLECHNYLVISWQYSTVNDYNIENGLLLDNNIYYR